MPHRPASACPGPISRRELLRVGGSGLLGLSLSRLLEAEERKVITPRADSCIILFLNGGPSHLDMWDMKPEAPDGIRGEFKPISTSVPGIPFSEHLPKLAHAHASLDDRALDAPQRQQRARRGRVCQPDRARPGRQLGGLAPRQLNIRRPASVLAHAAPSTGKIVPHVCLPYITKEGAGGPPQPGFFGGLLGRAYDPLFVLKDPNAADFSVPEFTAGPMSRSSGSIGAANC